MMILVYHLTLYFSILPYTFSASVLIGDLILTTHPPPRFSYLVLEQSIVLAGFHISLMTTISTYTKLDYSYLDLC